MTQTIQEEIDISAIASECFDSTPEQKKIMSHGILGQIVSQIPKIDMTTIKASEMDAHGDLEKLERQNKNGETYFETPKVTPREMDIYLTRLINYTINKSNYDLNFIEGWPYLFNGKYWEQIPEKNLEEFLCLCAAKTGLYYSLVAQAKRKKKLYNQYISDFSKLVNMMDNISVIKKPILINLQNGTLELSGATWRLREFRKEDYNKYQLSFSYDPEAKCPMFDAFLDEVLPEKEAQDILMEMIGYCFIPTKSMKLERCLMLYGPGANGKGVIFNIVVAIIGENHVRGFSMESLSNDPNARAQLRDILLNYSTELGGKCNPDMIKKLVSGEPVHVKTLYKDVTMMSDYSTKFMFNSNTLPRGAENTFAFFRRWIILPFNHEVPKEKRDIHLSDKLMTELPGIFNRVLSGIKRLVENEDFTSSKLVDEMLEQYKEQTNSVLRFIKDEGWIPSVPKHTTEHVSSEVPHVTRQYFYAEYKKYCESNGCTSSTSFDFGKKIKEYFLVQTKRTNNDTWIFVKKETDYERQKQKENDNVIEKLLSISKSE